MKRKTVDFTNNKSFVKQLLITTRLTVAALAVAGSAAQADIINGGFETGNLSGWSTLGNVGVSTGVTYGSSGTINPFSGTYSALLTTENASAADLAATMGVSEATLEATNGGINATNGSLLYQTVTATAGFSFQFKWNFVEQDYLPYDDWAFYGISFNNGPAVLTKFVSLGEIGPILGSPANNTTLAGWNNLFVDIPQDGDYTFYFGAVNALDTSLNSQLWIDGVTSRAPVGGGESVPDGGTTLALLGLSLAGLGGLQRKLRK
jgi:hypothetical protein